MQPFALPRHALAALLLVANLSAEPLRVTVHADRPAGELRPIWNAFGYDEALTTLTPEGRHLLGELVGCPNPAAVL